MKFYGLKREKLNEDFKYAIARVQTLASSLILNKEKRERRKAWYKHLFKDEYEILSNEDLSIPEGKYYIPIAIISTDLIAKENVASLKRGLKNLLLKYKSHKYYGAHQSISEIFETIDTMDDTYSVWREYLDCGTFDFSLHPKVEKHIDYFDIKIRNYNSSFFALETRIFLAENVKEKMIAVINKDYKHERGFASYYFSNNAGKSGSRKNVTIIRYNNAHLKSEIINNMMIETKWYVFNLISKYFPLVLHKRGVMPPSVNLYKTNIDLRDDTANSFLSSVGVYKLYGQYITNSEKLFFQSFVRDSKTHKADMIYVVNEIEHDRIDGFYSFDYQIVYEFTKKYNVLYKLYLAKTINNMFASICVKHKNKINKIKLKKHGYNKILKARYLFEKDMDLFKRFSGNTDWEKEKASIKMLFSKAPLEDSYFYDYRFLAEGVMKGQEKILDSIESIEKDIEQKHSIIKYMSDYVSQRRSVSINILMLVIASITLSLIIFPDRANWFAGLLINIYNWFYNLIMIVPV